MLSAPPHRPGRAQAARSPIARCISTVRAAGRSPSRLAPAAALCAPSRARGPFHLAMPRVPVHRGPRVVLEFLPSRGSGRGLDALEDLFVPGDIPRASLAPASRSLFTARAAAARARGGPSRASALLERSRALAGGAARRARPTGSRRLPPPRTSFSCAAATPAGSYSVIAGLSVVRRLGTRHHDRAAGPRHRPRALDIAAGILRTFARFVDRGHAAEPLSRRGRRARVQHRRRHALDVPGARRLSRARSAIPSSRASSSRSLMAIIACARARAPATASASIPRDGLLRAGEPGMQLTWMDAKHGDRVFTPRIGKPVEINALWLNALDVAARLAGRVRRHRGEAPLREPCWRAPRPSFRALLERRARCLYDVIDVDGGTGSRCRASGPTRSSRCRCPTARSTGRTDARGGRLLRTRAADQLRAAQLEPRGPALHRPLRGRSVASAMRAYHQGTAWAWLLGPFVRAHYRVYGDARAGAVVPAPDRATPARAPASAR